MTLRPYQIEAKEAIYRYFSCSGGNPLVVAPTGSGKSVMIADLIAEICQNYDNQHIISLTHVQELISQNVAALQRRWPQAPVGIYSASLRRKEIRQITFASIQSVFKIPDKIGYRQLCIIDEAHLLSTDAEGMYRRFLAGLTAINPRLRIIGFTATPYRLKSGLLHHGDNALFTDICYDIPMTRLLKEGYLARLSSKPSVTQADMKGVATVAGDFSQVQASNRLELITEQALNEVCSLASGRRSWLIFCSGVQHAMIVRDALRRRNIPTEAVTGETPKAEREAVIQAYRSGALQAITNANVLTTGFDAPATDLIVLLRATKSPGLYVQMLGRGMRISLGKENCLVLDYAGNIERFGPVTHLTPPDTRRTGTRNTHKQPCRVCPICRSAAPWEAEFCEDCGEVFKRERTIKHETVASEADLISDAPVEETKWVDVTGTLYARHNKKGGLPSLRVSYQHGLTSTNEFICLEHPGFAGNKARRWWMNRANDPPETIDDALERTAELPTPTRIRIRKSGKYNEVVDYDFTERSAPGTHQSTQGNFELGR